MARNKTLIFWVVLFVLLFSLAFYSKINIYSNDLNIHILGISDFKLMDTYENEGGTIINIESKKDNALIKIRYIKEIEKEASDEYKYYQLKIINSVFEPVKSPYPDRITQERICLDQFKPIKVDKGDTNSTYYLMYSTGRYSYGACSWDSINYKVIFLFRYCEAKKELYQVEIFVPVDEFNENYTKMAENISCK